ncbi:MAG: hypothetical protein M1823_008015, partial [Watsoniomyces obsoletus]
CGGHVDANRSPDAELDELRCQSGVGEQAIHPRSYRCQRTHSGDRFGRLGQWLLLERCTSPRVLAMSLGNDVRAE